MIDDHEQRLGVVHAVVEVVPRRVPAGVAHHGDQQHDRPQAEHDFDFAEEVQSLCGDAGRRRSAPCSSAFVGGVLHACARFVKRAAENVCTIASRKMAVAIALNGSMSIRSPSTCQESRRTDRDSWTERSGQNQAARRHHVTLSNVPRTNKANRAEGPAWCATQQGLLAGLHLEGMRVEPQGIRAYTCGG